jgi:hypothetical protein
VLDQREAVHDHQPPDRLGVVERGSVRHRTSAVVAHDGEPLVAEELHHRAYVGCHGSLGRLGMVGLVRRQRRASVATEVRADHGVPLGQPGCDGVPRRVGARVAVQQDHGAAAPAVADAERHVPDRHHLEAEVVEHLAAVTSGPFAQRELRNPGG